MNYIKNKIDYISSDQEIIEKLRTIPLGRINKIILWCFSTNNKILRLLIKLILHIELPSPPPKGLRLGHPFNVVVHGQVDIGENTTIFQGVTIGESRIGNRRGIPHIGSNVIIYPNSIVVGNVKIGNGAIIGAGSVVTIDIPDNAVAIGNPARVLRILNHK
jgi:serine acetyltransferase